jgi:hypothetical protein
MVDLPPPPGAAKRTPCPRWAARAAWSKSIFRRSRSCAKPLLAFDIANAIMSAPRSDGRSLSPSAKTCLAMERIDFTPFASSAIGQPQSSNQTAASPGPPFSPQRSCIAPARASRISQAGALDPSKRNWVPSASLMEPLWGHRAGIDGPNRVCLSVISFRAMQKAGVDERQPASPNGPSRGVCVVNPDGVMARYEPPLGLAVGTESDDSWEE